MPETYVTGANGFIGKKLVERLPNFVAVPHREIDTKLFWPFSCLYFLSAYGNMADQQDDKQTIKANVTDLTRILGQVDWENPFSSFVYISSSSVKLPVQTMYSRTKKAAEEILLSFMERYDAPISIVRPFSVTGVGEQPQHLIPTLIRSCMTGELVNFVPEPSHDFIDVEDVVDGILNLSNSRAKGIFELGTGIMTTNAEVLQLVEEITGRKANINIVNSMRSYDNNQWVSKNYKGRGYGWLPKKTLRQSITEMVSAYK